MVPAAPDGGGRAAFAVPVTLAFWSGKGQATDGKEHTMSVIAYIHNPLGADPGVLVRNDDGSEDLDFWPAGPDVWTGEQWDAWMLQIGPGLDGRPADLDYDAADELLAEHNHRRIEPWHASGGQWAAEVECIDGRE